MEILPKNTCPVIGGVAGGLYVQASALLNVKARNFVSSLNLNVKGFVLCKDGSLQEIKLDYFVPASDGSEVLLTPFTLREGILMAVDVAIQSTSSLVREGDCFVSINIQAERANIANSALVVNLASGYVTNTKSISYPSAGIQGMTDTIGKATIIEVTRPAANGQWTYTIPDHRRFRLNAISFELVNDANAGNRTLKVMITPAGSANGLIYTSTSALIASHTGYYAWSLTGKAETQVTSGTDDFIDVPFPNGLELHAGDVITSLASNFQVGDRYNRVQLYGKLWIDVGTAAGVPGGGGGAS